MMTLLVALLAAPASAADLTPQSAMVADALRAGALTTAEVGELQSDLNEIDRVKRVALRDGRIDAHERRRIASLEAAFKSRFDRLTHNHLRR